MDKFQKLLEDDLDQQLQGESMKIANLTTRIKSTRTWLTIFFGVQCFVSLLLSFGTPVFFILALLNVGYIYSIHQQDIEYKKIGLGICTILSFFSVSTILYVFFSYISVMIMYRISDPTLVILLFILGALATSVVSSLYFFWRHVNTCKELEYHLTKAPVQLGQN
eukprot:NODE_413_length_7912_cov_0.917061.p7 type:complete len:165 gc:universal NODE_413_length_7912_cov_0.917061:6445-6939(+)